MKNKYIRGLALGMAAMTAFTFTTPQASLLSVEAATATKATKGTSKITASKKTVKVAKGNTATVKLTLNKKQAKDLKITVKSKNNKIAKVTNAKKVIVKKGKKVASVKIKGVKANSSTKVVASFKTGAGKTKKVTITVKVNPIALTKVTLNNKTPKVGDTLTATISPSNASAVTYKWYMGDSASDATTVISGQTKKTLTVTDAMAGKFIKVVATGKTAAGKAASKSATTTAAVEAKTTPEPEPTTPDIVDTKVAVTGVSLSNTAPKVGDTVTATVAPENATNVTYAWFLGNSSNGLTDAIPSATTKEIKITEDMVGKYLGVVVSGEDNSSANAATAVAIQKADATAIAVTKAEQAGMAKVKVTFSNAVTAQDKITVKKGATEQTIKATDYDADFKSATLTLANNLSSGTYTVTLTPADTAVAASTAEFAGVSATKATSISFDNNYLVLADTSFKKGYCFVHGKNDFGENITLSGLTITAAPSDSTSYDSSTGKITVESKTDSQYAIVKTVSVFVQYTGADGLPLTANANLEVSSIGYPSKVTFGEIKKDGTMRDDKKLTIGELGTNKYYVELSEIEDQYGNSMTVDDLNDLANDNLVTIVPTVGSTSMFFGINKTPFSEVNGKPVMFLTTGNMMPGTAKLMITSAGGSFEKDITIEDNPFVQTMTMDVPDVYTQETTDEFTFTAVDQYDDAVDLYDFAPKAVDGTGKTLEEGGTAPFDTLVFTDANHLTNNSTKVTASDRGNWSVKKDTAKKTFTVKYTPNAATAAKGVITFTCISAGMVTKVSTVTVGELGGARQIVGQTSSVQIDPEDNDDFNFAEKLQFKDANGKTMKRSDQAASYPRFMDKATLNTIMTDSSIEEKDYTGYYWTLTTNKLETNSIKLTTDWAGNNVGAGNVNAYQSIAASATADAIEVDNDGVIDINGAGAAGKNTDDGFLKVNGDENNETYYVTLLAKGATNYVVLDSEAFRFVYVPTQPATKYEVEDVSDKLLYAATDSKDEEEIKIKASNNNGESWIVTTGITLAPDAPFSTGTASNMISGKIAKDFNDNTDGTVAVKVYYNGKAVDTINLKYSNRTPVATATETKLSLTPTDIGNGKTAGAWYEYDAVEESYKLSTITKSEAGMVNGTFTITNVYNYNDIYTAIIKDQYDVKMEDSTVKLNGNVLTDSASALDANTTGNFVITNGSKKIDIDVETGSLPLVTHATVASASRNAGSESALRNGILAASAATGNVEITLTDSFALSSTITIPANVTVVVPSGKVFDLSGKAVTLQGNIENNGIIITDGTTGLNNTALLSGKGVYRVVDKTTFDALVQAASKNYSVEVAGTFTSTATTYNVPVKVNSTNTLTTAAGTTANANVTVEGQGQLTFGNGTFTIAANKSLSSTGTLEVNGTSTVIDIRGTFVDDGTFTMTTTGTIENKGTMTLKGAGYVQNGTTIKVYKDSSTVISQKPSAVANAIALTVDAASMVAATDTATLTIADQGTITLNGTAKSAGNYLYGNLPSTCAAGSAAVFTVSDTGVAVN